MVFGFQEHPDTGRGRVRPAKGTGAIVLLAVLLAPAVRGQTPVPRAARVELQTADGALLRGKRYTSEGPPVILLPGLAASLFQFDLSNKGSPSLAAFLHEKGFDVWLFNFRGAGRGQLVSHLPAGAEGWCADHLILYDLPAIHEHVARATKSRPFLVGHSMGGLVVAAYLAGAEAREPTRSAAGVRISPERARDRNREVRGAVLLSTPLVLRWSKPRKTFVRLAKLARGSAGRLLPRRLRVSRLNLWNADDAPLWIRKAREELEDLVEEELAQSTWVPLVFGAETQEHARLLLKKFRGRVLTDTSRGVLRQLAHGVGQKTWMSHLGTEREWIDYAAHYGRIRTPVLVVIGTEDGVADAVVQRSVLEQRVGSKDRTFLKVQGYGHSGMTLGDGAPRDVYPAIARWLERR